MEKGGEEWERDIGGTSSPTGTSKGRGDTREGY